MNPPETQLVSRIERLERQNHWMRACLMVLLIAGTCVAVVGAKAASDDETLEAKRIVIRDEDGNRRVLLGMEDVVGSAQPRSGVFVYDETGKQCTGLSSEATGTRLFIEQNGGARLYLGTGKDQFVGLVVNAEAGKSDERQILMAFANDGKPMYAFNDRNGKTRIMMMLDNAREEKPVFLLQDKNQQAFFAKIEP